MKNKIEFETYIRTNQFWDYRLKDIDELRPKYVSSKTITEKFNLSEIEIQELIDDQRIKRFTYFNSEGYAYYKYSVLKKGAINPKYIEKSKGRPLDDLTLYMKKILPYVSLIENAPSTPFFNVFLKLKDTSFLDLFFKVDTFSGRIHTPISSFKKDYRLNILINGEKTDAIDVATMQPLLLGKILNEEIGKNEYSDWIENGLDIYEMLKEIAYLKNRDEAKKLFFQILFSKPNNDLVSLFGNKLWITWINKFKSVEIKANPHHKTKPHSNLAWWLQSKEVELMRKVWNKLKINKIPFLSVHDEILIPENKILYAENYFHSVLSKEFKFYKLNIKSKTGIEKASIQTENVESKWNQQLLELENYFDKIQNMKIMLNNHTTISDLKLFVKGHVSTLKLNEGKFTFMPYLERLKEVKKITTKQILGTL